MPVKISGFVIFMKLKIKSKPLPVGVIYPEGGEPLYEEAGTGLRLTASDFAAKHGYENTSEVEKKYIKEVENGRRTATTDDNQDSTGI